MHKITSYILGILILASAFIPVQFGYVSADGIASSSIPVQVWWPTPNATVTGNQPFKSMLTDARVNSYQMYWQVDGGQLNLMQNNFTDYPHKESVVDVTNWNWKGVGPYKIKFIAKDLNGTVIGQSELSIYRASKLNSISSVVAPKMNNLVTVTKPQTDEAAIFNQSKNTNNFKSSDSKLYVDINNPAQQQANAWRTNRPTDATQLDKIGSQSQAQWFGNWNNDVYRDVRSIVDKAAAQNSVPVLVAYNIPQRDCGGYSSGGVNSVDGYKSWINNFAQGIGSKKAIVILEPDAIAQIDCLSKNDIQTRMSLLSDAVSTLKKSATTSVYLDAGHAKWLSASEAAARLLSAGLSKADGFSLNISNFISTDASALYGTQISRLTGGKHFVIDTGRNGKGGTGNSEWCNPSGQALGQKPTTNTGQSIIDAYLWIKVPGESDGNCNGGPDAGIFWPDYALGLAERASY